MKIAVLLIVAPMKPWSKIHELGQKKTWMMETGSELRDIEVFSVHGRIPGVIASFLHDLSVLILWGWGKTIDDVRWIQKNNIAFRFYKSLIKVLGLPALKLLRLLFILTVVATRTLVQFYMYILGPFLMYFNKVTVELVESRLFKININHLIYNSLYIQKFTLKEMIKNANFDYIVITTSSAYLDLKKIRDFLTNSPQSYDFYGKIMNNSKQFFYSGFIQVWSKNMVDVFLSKKYMPTALYSDIYLTHLVKNRKLQVHPLDFSIIDKIDLKTCPLCTHHSNLAIKCVNLTNRENEIKILKSVHKIHKSCRNDIEVQ